MISAREESEKISHHITIEYGETLREINKFDHIFLERIKLNNKKVHFNELKD